MILDLDISELYAFELVILDLDISELYAFELVILDLDISVICLRTCDIGLGYIRVICL